MNIQQKIRQYFQSKAKELLALSEQALSDHSGLTGNHRERILCDFISEISPKRHSIDREFDKREIKFATTRYIAGSSKIL